MYSYACTIEITVVKTLSTHASDFSTTMGRDLVKFTKIQFRFDHY